MNQKNHIILLFIIIEIIIACPVYENYNPEVSFDAY